MRKLMVGLAMATVAQCVMAADGAGFKVSFADYKAGETLSDKGATGGGWLPLAAETFATNVVKGGENALRVFAPNSENPLTFTNAVGIGVSRSRYDFRVSFEAANGINGMKVDAATCGVMMGKKSDGTLALAGAAGGDWHLLLANGFNPQLDEFYDLRIETCQIGNVMYSAFFVKQGESYVGLTDEHGASLFRLARAADDDFSRVTLTGNGLMAVMSGGEYDAVKAVANDWTGTDSGDWTDPANWASNAVPAVGEYVRVNGKVKLTNGKESATVTNLLAQVGTDGKLVMKSGIISTSLSLDLTSIDNRPRAGKKFAIAVGTFMGLTPTVACTWFRGTPQKNYESSPVSETTDYTFATSDYSHWFKVDATDSLATALSKEFYFSKLPVLYMTTDDGSTPTAQKETHTGQIVTQCGETKWKDKQMFSGAMEIKVRGNSTKSYPKKPWKIKLDKRTNMFGLSGDEKNKHWVLLANYNDESNMRNKLAYDFANDIGSLGMKSTWVECVLNGAWQGCYQFCEHIRIATERINIFNWEDEAEERGESDVDFSWVNPEVDDISGGYIFEASHEYDELTKFTVSSGKLSMRTMLNSPEYLYTNPAMTNWCVNFIQKYCDAITSVDGYSKEDKHWSEYCDNDSMVTYFLVMEMFGNNDASYKSRYFYKDRGKKMLFGPVWDFDWGVGNDVVLSTDDATGWKVRGNNASFYREWADDPWFCTRFWTLYHKKARSFFAAIIAKGGQMDADKELLAEAGAANDTSWYRKRGFTNDVEHLRTYLSNRLTWLDNQFKDVPTLISSLKTSSSTTPYSPATAMLPIAFANAPTNCIAQGKSLHLEFAVGDSSVTRTDVFVDGLRVEKGLAVEDGKFDAVIPASALTEAKGDPNCVSFVAYDSSDAVKGRNYALVTLTDFTAEDSTPETTEGGVKIPSVPHEWICKEVATLPGMGYLTAASDAEFALAVKSVPSPTGKMTPLWQDYVAGTNPDPDGTNTEFVVSEFSVTNGVPYIKWTPDLGNRRSYTTEGKVNLNDEQWETPPPSGARFFRVKVDLPK